MKFKNLRFITIIAIICYISINISNVEAVQINSKNKIKINEEIIVTLDFGTYIAAYDSLEVTYNDRILKYNSSFSLIEGLWWDTSYESKGINKKVYSFIGKGNGESTINIKVKGLVSANSTMDELGDVEISKKIIVGKGMLKGDVDGNGIITANDAAIILDLYKNGKTTKDDISVADMDGNNIINSNDAAIILDMYKRGII